MVLIGNYGGHMAFATDPPYCVAYSVDYKTNDPSQMTPRHTQNLMYAMVTSNMIVRKEAVVFASLGANGQETD